VAENGYGKTTILNMLYYVITGDIGKLKKIDFSSIQVIFADGKKFEIKHSELNISESSQANPFYDHLKLSIPKNELDELIETYLELSEAKFKSSKIFKNSVKKTNFDESSMLTYFKRYIGDNASTLFNIKVQKTFDAIKVKFPSNILYLPTYRRVEIDLGLENSSDEKHIKSDLINFGMKDVEDLIKLRTQEILKSSVEWFSKVNGQMLSQLAEGFSLDDELKESIKNPEAVKIVLDRIGNNIDERTKLKILLLIESDEIFKDHDPLIYFISNLVKVYEQQKDNDQALQNFTEVCNRYLGDKMIKYNEGSVSVQVVRRKNATPVEMESLSSGEKQIISIFAKLYLQKHDSYAVFFDEPELSLSMEWQRTLLPDIINSGMCEFLFSTTHSPFIFENDFEQHTVDLAEYIREL
jgi:energy-coupling factor transporter ATP-binding protein EcfA2